MTATDYTDQQDYAKFLQNKKSDKDCGCGGSCKECSQSDDCGCCPAGLVAVYDDKGQHLACLTPNDAELFKKNIMTCQDGYVKLFNTATGEFLGCVSEDQFNDLNASVNAQVVDPTGLAMIPADSTMTNGSTKQFYPQFSPLNTTNQAVTWSSNDATKALVDGNGLVDAIAVGTVTIIVTSVADPTKTASRLITIS